MGQCSFSCCLVDSPKQIPNSSICVLAPPRMGYIEARKNFLDSWYRIYHKLRRQYCPFIHVIPSLVHCRYRPLVHVILPSRSFDPAPLFMSFHCLVPHRYLPLIHTPLSFIRPLICLPPHSSFSVIGACQSSMRHIHDPI